MFDRPGPRPRARIVRARSPNARASPPLRRVNAARWQGLALVPFSILVGSPVISLVGIPLWFLVPPAFARAMCRRRSDALEAELVALVDDLAQQLRSGATLASGFGSVVAARPLTADLLSGVLGGVAAGRRLPDSLDEVAERSTSPEPLRLLSASLAVLVSTGGSVGPGLERLSQTLRSSRAAAIEARTHASQALASAGLLALLPLIFSVLLGMVEPAARGFYLTSVTGGSCVAAMVVLVALGWRWTEHAIWGRSGRPGGIEHRSRNLASTIDLVSVVLGSGGTTAHALRLVQARGPVGVRAPVTGLLDRWHSGVNLSRVLVEMPEAIGEEYRSLASALVSTERDGAPVGALLARLGDEARVVRRQIAEVRARRLSVQLLLPLVCCSLPAVIVGAVVPLVIVGFGRL